MKIINYRPIAFLTFFITTIFLSSSAFAATSDLVFNRTLSASTYKIGEQFSYGVSVSNNGPDNAAGAQIIEKIPSGFTVVGTPVCNTTAGAVCGAFSITGSVSLGYTLSSTLTSFPNKSSAGFQITVNAPSITGSYVFNGSVDQAVGNTETSINTNSMRSNLTVRSIVVDVAVSLSASDTTGITPVVIPGYSSITTNINGDNTGSLFPYTTNIKIENKGPDPISGRDFRLRGNLGSWGGLMGRLVGQYALQENLSFSTISTFTSLPFNCVATGTVSCAAPVVYAISRFTGIGNGLAGQGWLPYKPTYETTTSGFSSLITADKTNLGTGIVHPFNSSPLFGQIFNPGDTMTLSATVTDDDLNNGRLSTTLFPKPSDFFDIDFAYRQTSKCVGNNVCSFPLGNTLATARITYKPGLALFDNNLDNNAFDIVSNATRTLPSTDLSVISTGPVSMVQVTPYAFTFKLENINGAGAPIQTANFGFNLPLSTWDGFTSNISCTSTGGAICPNATVLGEMLAASSTSNISKYLTGLNMGPGEDITITVLGDAGTVTCPGIYTAGNKSYGAVYSSTNFTDPLVLNNGSTTSNTVNFLSPACPTPNNYDLAIVKNGPFDSAGLPLASVAPGDRVYYKLSVFNNSTNGVMVKNMRVTDAIGGLYVGTSLVTLASDIQTQAGPFQKHPGGANGLPFTGTGVTGSSGIVCTSFGTAVCPTKVFGTNQLTSADVDDYDTFGLVIPQIPPPAASPLADPTAKIELLVPYVVQAPSTVCAAGATFFRKYNTARTNTLPGGIGAGTSVTNDLTLEPLSEYYWPTGLALEPSQRNETSTADNASNTYSQIPVPPCVAALASLTKTIVSPAIGDDSNGINPTASHKLPESTTVSYVATITNTGVVPLDVVQFTDTIAPVCQNAGVVCGGVVPVSVVCVPSVGSTCPPLMQFGKIITNNAIGSNTTASTSLDITWGTPSANTIPVGGSVAFTVTYTLSGKNVQTTNLTNTANIIGSKGVSFFPDVTNRQAVIKFTPAGELTLNKRALNPVVPEGGTAQWEIQIVNSTAFSVAAGAILIDTPPALTTGFTVLSCTPFKTDGSAPTITCPGDINTLGTAPITLPVFPSLEGIKILVSAVLPTSGTYRNDSTVVPPIGATFGVQDSNGNVRVFVDPTGVVYDANTRLPVAGAEVTFCGPVGFDAATMVVNANLYVIGPANCAKTTTDGTGIYQYFVFSNAPAGLYTLSVKAPSPYTLGYAPSIASGPSISVTTPGLTPQLQVGAPSVGQDTTYYSSFNWCGTCGPIVNNHLPVSSPVVSGGGGGGSVMIIPTPVVPTVPVMPNIIPKKETPVVITPNTTSACNTQDISDIKRTCLYPQTSSIKKELLDQLKLKSVFSDIDINDEELNFAATELSLRGIITESILRKNDTLTKEEVKTYIASACGAYIEDSNSLLSIIKSCGLGESIKVLKDKNLLSSNTKIGSRGEFFTTLFRVLTTKELGLNKYTSSIKYSTKILGSKSLIAQRTLLSREDVWVPTLQDGAGFYQDPTTKQIVLFAHSSNYTKDPKPTGKLFKPLIGKYKKGDTLTIEQNGKTKKYKVVSSSVVNKNSWKDTIVLDTKTQVFMFTCSKPNSPLRDLWKLQEITK